MKQRRFVMGICLLAAVVMMSCSPESLFLGAYIDGNADALAAPAGSDDTSVTFTIEMGQSVETIANQLEGQGLISDAELFRRYVQYKGLDSGIQAGSYTLRQTMTIPEIALALQQANSEEQQVTLPEGKRMEELAILIATQTTIKPDAVLEAAKTGWQQTAMVTAYPFMAQIPMTGTLEGFLFPDTYRLPVDATAYDLIERMMANYAQQVTADIQQGFAAQGMTLYEGMTLASIVEREAVRPEERAIIAGVYKNRLRDGWPLSACPTVQYALGYRADEGSWWKSQLFFGDLEVDSPYNTYRVLGLPPAPIASPGLSSIQAAAFPAETSYYFFMVDCTKNDGSHFFAENEAEHLQNFELCGGVITSP